MRREDLPTENCGIAQTLGVVGDWWSWLILREVAGGTTRFDGLQSALGVSRRALTERLATLVDAGVLARTPYLERPPRFDYLLTARGEGLLPVLVAMQEFGDRYLLGDGTVTAAAQDGSPEVIRVRSLVGRRVPDLALPAHDGSEVSLRGPSWRVLFLFPGAFAPDTDGYPDGWSQIPGAAGCTLEAMTYAARHDAFDAAGVEVYGVSTQRTDQQAAFAAHAGLPYLLLSDQDSRLTAALRPACFRAAGADRFKRQTLVLDPAGLVRHVQVPVTDPAGSVDDVLTVVRDLATSA
jgi:DNA-binding HxlR family transcriptional regulator/peroxiredoxin